MDFLFWFHFFMLNISQYYVCRRPKSSAELNDWLAGWLKVHVSFRQVAWRWMAKVRTLKTPTQAGNVMVGDDTGSHNHVIDIILVWCRHQSDNNNVPSSINWKRTSLFMLPKSINWFTFSRMVEIRLKLCTWRCMRSTTFGENKWNGNYLMLFRYTGFDCKELPPHLVVSLLALIKNCPGITQIQTPQVSKV